MGHPILTFENNLNFDDFSNTYLGIWHHFPHKSSKFSLYFTCNIYQTVHLLIQNPNQSSSSDDDLVLNLGLNFMNSSHKNEESSVKLATIYLLDLIWISFYKLLLNFYSKKLCQSLNITMGILLWFICIIYYQNFVIIILLDCSNSIWLNFTQPNVNTNA